MIVYLRLAFGTLCVLAPGWAVARAIGQRSVSAVLAWTMASIFVAWAAVFTLHRSIHLAVAVLALILLVALIVRHRHEPGSRREPGSRVWLLGVVLGWLLWHVEGAVTGDGLFHEARVRKLVDLTSLHLRSVDEFKDGGLHPGYASGSRAVVRHMHEDMIGTSASPIADASFLCTTASSSTSPRCRRHSARPWSAQTLSGCWAQR